ncbi:hypothetical protein K470DRAFT_219902 [Piedraia hortae CBS 480.64]|uniref:DUF7907 domain-containing protein n=1 Tax=Piedraia hortae CBS 480.64 TaxID=1314780 RepID=A0A6A7BUN4_9PEZI|nr:hypothetical protein K470DRAFT_219902 [Piedraia hortae CBS 480.64]
MSGLLGTVIAQFDNQTANFFLVVDSPGNEEYDGTTFGGCHEGAAIEGLCPGNEMNATESYQFFQHNTSSYSVPSGILTYELHGADFNISEPMQLGIGPLSNMADPLFTPGYQFTEVAFDKDEKMYIADSKGNPYYRWYICDNVSYYRYTGLQWLIGTSPDSVPDEPSCRQTNVTRKWVKE